jgi:endonuclease/exonuclease/phosphatase family metal-dependent hydrolase
MDELRVGTFNVRHCRGLDDVVDVERTAGTIRALNVDFLALQELDSHRERSGREDQPARLAELTGLEVSFHPTIEGHGDYGIAVAGKGLEEIHFELLPREGSEEPRGVIVARIGGITFLTTHLSRQHGARRLQLDRLAALVLEAEPPVVVMGDLQIGARALGPLRKIGFEPGPPTPTYPTARPRHQIDYVLAGPGLRLVTLETVESEASDHLPLVGTVSVEENA